MGDLDRFKAGSQASSGKRHIALGDKRDLSWLSGEMTTEEKQASRTLNSGPARFALALDATGSMSGLIEMAKNSIEEILRRIMREAGMPVEIMLVAYRDYDVPNDLVKVCGASPDHNALIAWLKTISAHGGGSNDGEAIEKALEAIMAAGHFEALLLAGDEPPNSRASLDGVGRKGQPTAQDLARQIGQGNTPIHTFVVGSDRPGTDDPRTVAAFREIASITGGEMGRLDGSAAMIDMAVMAMLSALKGSRAVQSYMDRHKLTSSSAAFGHLLIAGPKK